MHNGIPHTLHKVNPKISKADIVAYWTADGRYIETVNERGRRKLEGESRDVPASSDSDGFDFGLPDLWGDMEDWLTW